MTARERIDYLLDPKAKARNWRFQAKNVQGTRWLPIRWCRGYDI
jgi:hypothetical protein